MWKGNLTICHLLAVLCALVLGGATCAAGSYVHFYDGEYLLSTPATKGRTHDRLPPTEGKALLERLLKPGHMILTGLGADGQGVLRVGDDTRQSLHTLLGAAARLPDWRKSLYNLGFVSNQPGDSTVVVVQLGVPDLEPPDHVTGVLICFSPSVLPKEYRPYLKRFVPSQGIHAGLATQSGLKLGMTRAEVEAVLGKPLWKTKDAYEYGALGDIQFTPEFLITRWNWPKDVQAKPGGIQHSMDVWFVGGRVSAFHVWKLYDM
ncbi:MAG: hypothetical protein KKA55_13840 [Proteobacteria bacterium]|nr:hypothetical protein [Pseudomonadota bacterium]MBU1596602.1 hypothetical protein [Pseudomonadota bacterium]